MEKGGVFSLILFFSFCAFVGAINYSVNETNITNIANITSETNETNTTNVIGEVLVNDSVNSSAVNNESSVYSDSPNISRKSSSSSIINKSSKESFSSENADNFVGEYIESNNIQMENIVNPYFVVKNSSDIVAWFDGQGNLSLIGNCSVSSDCVAPEDSFIIRNPNYETVAYISPSGNLCLEGSSCSNIQSSCNPSSDAFIIQNSGINVSYINFTGGLCLTGSLNENVQ